MKSFTDLGLSLQLVEVCEKQLDWYDPLKIQAQVIPLALEGKDVYAISPPRSGKTGAFVLPIFQALLNAGPNLNPFFACVISSSRNFAFEIARYFEALGQHFGVKFAVLVSTSDMEYQTNKILQQPHIIVATPGKLVKHLKDTPAFSLRKLKYLVLDEAHLLESNYKHIDRQLEFILGKIPRNRTTFLFSDSKTDKVDMIQSVFLRNPVKIDESIEYPEQQQCHMPAKDKDCYLAHTLSQMAGKTSLVFTWAYDLLLRLALTLFWFQNHPNQWFYESGKET
ncbi:DEAD-box ATP-dependent RNA helicase 10 isoform X1 [Medicago truncatula]|uniref:DEAD-box ATP-dependent RNA helicase 10 isoform X1 n=1 Tax=Medicago truncatula TaxID=3880 RepID=UPI001967E2B7|nr:DEAD-box ATP-dependent RNA helicase 10 isoform X1 [Medicago truncatula]